MKELLENNDKDKIHEYQDEAKVNMFQALVDSYNIDTNYPQHLRFQELMIAKYQEEFEGATKWNNLG